MADHHGLDTSAQLANIGQLGIEALAPPIASVIKWIHGCHPDARIEKWMKRLDPVMKTVKDNIYNIPEAEMAIFITFVDE